MMRNWAFLKFIFKFASCSIHLAYIMKLSDKLCLYEVLVSIAIFIAIAVVVETYAVRSESRQAEEVTRMLQKESVDNMEVRLNGVSQAIRRIARKVQTEPLVWCSMKPVRFSKS